MRKSLEFRDGGTSIPESMGLSMPFTPVKTKDNRESELEGFHQLQCNGGHGKGSTKENQVGSEIER